MNSKAHIEHDYPAFPSRIVNCRTRPPKKVAFAYSTKDRTYLSVRSIEPLFAEAEFDVFWMDGSTTEEGEVFPLSCSDRCSNLIEIHFGVRGGPDAAIIYSLSYLLQKGYEYIGLIENDVLLKPGWFEKLMSLFSQGEDNGLKVGAVSARTIQERVLVSCGNYAIMFNLGAGMILMPRDAANAVLQRYRTTTAREIRAVFRCRAGVDLDNKRIERALVDDATIASADWFYDAGLLLDGFCSLAPIPTFAENIDTQFVPAGRHVVEEDSKIKYGGRMIDTFRERLQRQFQPVPVHTSSAYSEKCIVFPHQLLTCASISVSESWKIKWKQNFGPFSFVSDADDASITLPFEGTVCSVLLEVSPESGNIEIVANGNILYNLSLRSERRGVIALPCKVNSMDRNTVVLRSTSRGVTFCGVQVLDSRSIRASERTFDFSVIQQFY